MNLVPLFMPDKGLSNRIRLIEETVEAPLPQDYVNFLHKMNGASTPKGEKLGVRIYDGSYTDLAILYGSGQEVPNYARLEYWMHKRPQPASLVVGSDSGGNFFWISLTPGNYGTVYYKQEDYSEADGPVAMNWSSFLDLKDQC